MKKILGIMGILGGLFLIILRFFPPECAPITQASEVLCNRLWSPALFGMTLGFIGLFLTMRPLLTAFAVVSFIAVPVGFALMFIGNAVEYWLLYDLPHEGPQGFARGLAWMTVLFGLLLVLVASAIAGFLSFQLGSIPCWLSTLLVLLFPLTVVIGFVNINLAGMPIGVVSAAVGFSGLLRKGSSDKLVRSG
jgi:hypothetical protein